MIEKKSLISTALVVLSCGLSPRSGLQACDLRPPLMLGAVRGAGAHGGERLQSDFFRAKRQAAHVVATARPATLARVTNDGEVREWIVANKDKLKEALERTELVFDQNEKQTFCAEVFDAVPYVVHLLRAKCANITSIPKAGELLIHEAVHMLGIESESFAPAVAYVLYAAWELAGHALDHRIHPFSTENAPDGREDHTGVWTGKEFLIWGGYTNQGETNTGGRYDHVLDTWTKISAAGAPSARFGHSAIWADEDMIVWGGARTNLLGVRIGAHFADGGRYHAQNDKWQAIANYGAPSPRVFHTALWTGKNMVIWGGAKQTSLLLNKEKFLPYGDGASYDPLQDRWHHVSLKGAPTPRFAHSAVWTNSRLNAMIIWGGEASVNDDTTATTNSGAIYNFGTQSWKFISTVNAPSARRGHSAIWTGEKMIVWGGSAAAGENATRLNDGGIYNPATDTWETITASNAPEGRDGHIAVWTGSHMLVFGGRHPIAAEPESLVGQTAAYTPVALFDPKLKEWQTPLLNDVWMDRRGGVGAWTGHELLIWGGRGQRRSGRVFFP